MNSQSRRGWVGTGSHPVEDATERLEPTERNADMTGGNLRLPDVDADQCRAGPSGELLGGHPHRGDSGAGADLDDGHLCAAETRDKRPALKPEVIGAKKEEDEKEEAGE